MLLYNTPFCVCVCAFFSNVQQRAAFRLASCQNQANAQSQVRNCSIVSKRRGLKGTELTISSCLFNSTTSTTARATASGFVEPTIDGC